MRPAQTTRRLVIGALLPALLGSACTDLQLRKWRNDALIDSYRYQLGEQFVEVNGIRICYQEFGGGPTVVILPGLGSNLDYWADAVAFLAASNHVIAIDAPGYGLSEKPDGTYDITWMAEQIVAFLDAKSIARATLMGQSMGAHLAVIIADRHPERVDKLVLEGSIANWPTAGPILAGGFRYIWNDAVTMDHLRRNWPDIVTKLSIHDTPARERILRYQMAVRANGERYRPEGLSSSRTLRSILLTSLRERLATICIPVLLIWGANDRIHSVDNGIELRSLLDDSRLVVIADAGHGAMMDQPGEFSRLVQRFIEGGTDAIRDDPEALGIAIDSPPAPLAGTAIGVRDF